MIIDCDGCAVRGQACGDCVVGVLLGMPGPAGGDRPGPAPIRLDDPECKALSVLADQGLIPRLRLVARPGRDRVPEDGPQHGSGNGERPRAAG